MISDLKKFTSQFLSAEEYLKLSPVDKTNIESSRIQAPKLGSNDFGKIEVNYKISIYKKY